MAHFTLANPFGHFPYESQQIAYRYWIESVLHVGRRSVIYQVFDELTAQRFALKQLMMSTSDGDKDSVIHFQKEYHTLWRLKHPLVVDVYDYGIHNNRPYYTMELLQCNDTEQVTAIEWRRTCSLLRDAAAMLAMLHSQGMLHTELEPSDLQWTMLGRAKLINCGLMAPIGCERIPIGRPSFIPPEAANRQPIDVRADLYSLGSIAYRIFTGRDAYCLRDSAYLIDVWRSQPASLSSLVPAIPEALDRLVMSMLSLDRDRRPKDAFEVIERLTTIARLPEMEPLNVSRPVFNTPRLLGREDVITQFHKQMLYCMRYHGSVTIIEASSGMGRSRLLANCILEAKISGAKVISATSEDARKGEYGVIKALINDLLDIAKLEVSWALKRHVDCLAQLFPDLYERIGMTFVHPSISSQLPIPKIQNALRAFFNAFAVAKPLVIAIDDFHLCDSASAAIFATLCRDTRHKKLMMVFSLLKGATPIHPQAVQIVTRDAVYLKLLALSFENHRFMLKSLMGENQGVQELADRIYERSNGNPGTSLELLQYLIDCEFIQYREGKWLLLQHFPKDLFPAQLSQVYEARIERLNSATRALGEVLSIAARTVPLSIRDCLLVDGIEKPQQVFDSLDQFRANRVLDSRSGQYVFRSAGYIEAIQKGMNEERKREIHSRLAEVYRYNGSASTVVLIYHLQKAHMEKIAYELLLLWLESGDKDPAPFTLQLYCCETGLSYGEKSHRAIREQYRILYRLMVLCQTDLSLSHYAEEVLEMLVQDTGLTFWNKLNEEQRKDSSIETCVQMATKRWELLPAQNRGLEPKEALAEIPDSAMLMMDIWTQILDIHSLCRLYEFLDPFRSLSLSIDLLAEAVYCSIRQLQGDLVIDKLESLNCRLTSPDTFVKDDIRYKFKYYVLYLLGLQEAASFGLQGLKRAEQLALNPAFEPHAWQIRMYASLYLGNLTETHLCREKIEMLGVHYRTTLPHLAANQIFEVITYAMLGRFSKIKTILTSLRVLSKKYPGWQPVLYAMMGHYRLCRGDLRGAQRALKRLLSLQLSPKHIAWRYGLPYLVETLFQQGKTTVAYELAKNVRQEMGEPNPVSLFDLQLTCSLVKIEMDIGQYAQAQSRMEAAIEKAQIFGLKGIPLGNLYEVRAQLAIEVWDETAFTKYALLTADQYRAGANPYLERKYQQLIVAATRSDIRVSNQVKKAIQTDDITA